MGTRQGTSEEPLLRTLGYAMRELNREPDMSGSSVGHETVRLSLEPLSTEETSRVWQLFPTASYRTSVAYLVSPVWIDPAQPTLPAARVLEDSLKDGQKFQKAENHV